MFHAFSGSRATVGQIWIIGRLLGETELELEVRDDGLGMPQQLLEQILCKPSAEREPGYTSRYTHIGLFNVNERLRLHFGEGYACAFKACRGKGTSVTIKAARACVPPPDGADGIAR